MDGKIYPVTVSDEREALQAAEAAGRAIVGIWTPDGEYTSCLYLITKPEDATPELLERVVRRHLDLPWIIAYTERLCIREFSSDDPLETASADDGDGVFSDREKREAYRKNQYRFCECGLWALVCRENGRIVGKAGITGDELSYHIYEPYRKKGYALEACRAIVKYAWSELGLDALTVYIRKENTESLALAHALGFRPAETAGTKQKLILRCPDEF